MGGPAWRYDEFRQVGTDFTSPAEVDRYDERQGAQAGADEELLDLLRIANGTRVVDLGAGTGAFAVRAAGRGATVYAVDVSEAMLRAIERRAERTAVGDVRVRHGGFLTFELDGPPVDVVVSRYALHHLPDFWKQAALLRVAAMLRPGGAFFLRDVVFSFRAERAGEGLQSWIARMAAAGGWSREAFERHAREEHSTYAWIMEGLLERAGLAIDRATYADPAYADYLCRKPSR